MHIFTGFLQSKLRHIVNDRMYIRGKCFKTWFSYLMATATSSVVSLTLITAYTAKLYGKIN